MKNNLLSFRLSNNFFIITSLLLFLSINVVCCIDPVVPKFQFNDNLIFIEAFASTSNEASFVTVKESVLNEGRYSNVFINGAEISFINTNTGAIVMLEEQEETYVPPSDFVALVGDSWELHITLPDGRQYQSLPETVLEPVAISDIRAVYNPELLFMEASNNYVPGHSISVSFDDPPDRENYYYWRFRSFESLTFCEVCEDGIFRNGVCEQNPQESGREKYYTYTCDFECWQIRFNENIKLFADNFSNGNTINQLPIADVFLYTKQDILIEVQQFSLSSNAYEYYKTLKDITDNNESLNAPPPAALIGNMFNPNDDKEFVLGRFTAASTSIASVFINRSEINEPQINEKVFSQPESSPPIPQLEAVYSAPCVESRFRTGIRPQGWID